jgi:uncharacterized membrane protein
MLRSFKLAIVGAVLAMGTAAPVRAQDTAYEQCLVEKCFGLGGSAYETCRRGCAAKYPPQYSPQAFGKID